MHDLRYAVRSLRRSTGLAYARGRREPLRGPDGVENVLVAYVSPHFLSVLGAGIALDTVGALAATRLLASLLHGVAPTDLPTFTSVAVLLGTVAFLTCRLPARRAARVDPTVALGAE